jgi:hypothetical protein
MQKTTTRCLKLCEKSVAIRGEIIQMEESWEKIACFIFHTRMLLMSI